MPASDKERVSQHSGPIQPDVVLKGHLKIWEGFWAGWRNRWCILTEKSFTYYQSEADSQTPLGDVAVSGPRVRLEIDSKISSDLREDGPVHGPDSSAEETYLSFTSHGPLLTQHVHLQAESTSERDRWMLALMHVSRHALDVGDDPTAALLSRYLNNTRIYGDVLNHQVSRLAELGDVLSTYPEVYAVLLDSRIAAMATAAVQSCIMDAVPWVTGYEEHLHGLLDKEHGRQEELVELAGWIESTGRVVDTPAVDGTEESTGDYLLSAQMGNIWEDLSIPGLSADSDYRTQLTRFANYQDTISSISRSLTARVAALKALKHVAAASGALSGVQSECGLRPPSGPAYASAQSHRASSMVGRAASPAYSHYDASHSMHGRGVTFSAHGRDDFEEACRVASVADVALRSIATCYDEAARALRRRVLRLGVGLAQAQKRTEEMWQRNLDAIRQLPLESPDGDEGYRIEPPAEPLRNLLMDATFDLSAQQLFDLMFADESPGGAQLQAVKHYFNVHSQPWRETADGHRLRKLNYSLKVETPLGTKQSDTTDTQTLTWIGEAGFDVKSDVTAEGVPYASTFYNKLQYSVRGVNSTRCRVIISAELVWTAKPYFSKISSMIEQTADQALRDHATTWNGHVHDLIISGEALRLISKGSRPGSSLAHDSGSGGSVLTADMLPPPDHRHSRLPSSHKRRKDQRRAWQYYADILVTTLGGVCAMGAVATFIMGANMRVASK